MHLGHLSVKNSKQFVQAEDIDSQRPTLCLIVFLMDCFLKIVLCAEGIIETWALTFRVAALISVVTIRFH